MTTLKLFTREEGGKWNLVSKSISKERIFNALMVGAKFLVVDKNLNVSDWAALMFSDGTIYDKNKGFRSESDFPKEETIEYMNKILNGEI